MALPAKRIPKSVAHLDVEMVAAALIRHDANIRNAARALDVPSGDLRKLVLVDQRLADAALEAVELRLDDAEANLCEALRCGDPRRRDAVSMFILRQVRRWRGGEDPGALRWTTFSTRSIRLASPPSVTSAIGSTSGSGTISSSTRTSSAVSVVAGRSSQATGGRKHRTARLAGATIRLATMRGALSGKRRRGRRWGSRAEPFAYGERSRRVRVADVAVWHGSSSSSALASFRSSVSKPSVNQP